MRPSLAKTVLLTAAALTLTTAVLAALGEVAVRVVASHRLVYDIEMLRYATELKMPDPTGQVSHVHRANARARLMGVDVALNSLGHRSPELPAEKKPGRTRVLAIGSSVTMGWGVPQDQTFTALVEKRLNAEMPSGPGASFEFANAGVGNYNTHAQWLLFERQYPVVRPDFVVLHFFITDAEPRGLGRNNAILKRSYLAAYLYAKMSLLLSRFGPTRDLFEYYDSIYAEGSASWAQTRSEIGQMKAILDRDRVPFLVMIVPDFHDLAPGTPYASIYARIEAAFRAMGLVTLDTFGEFQRRYGGHEKDLWVGPDDPHPNARGHALMAELLYRRLVVTFSRRQNWK